MSSWQYNALEAYLVIQINESSAIKNNHLFCFIIDPKERGEIQIWAENWESLRTKARSYLPCNLDLEKGLQNMAATFMHDLSFISLFLSLPLRFHILTKLFQGHILSFCYLWTSHLAPSLPLLSRLRFPQLSFGGFQIFPPLLCSPRSTFSPILVFPGFAPRVQDLGSHFSEFPDLRIAHSSGYPGWGGLGGLPPS